MPQADVTILTGHRSEDTAHITYAYPYGRTRCLRREWVEQADKGPAKDRSRFVTQTTTTRFNIAYTDRINRDGLEAANAWAATQLAIPGLVQWNKPSPSTYSAVVVMVAAPLDDGSGRIGTHYCCLHEYPSLTTLNEFRDVLANGNPAFNEREQRIFDRIVRRTEAAETPRELAG